LHERLDQLNNLWSVVPLDKVFDDVAALLVLAQRWQMGGNVRQHFFQFLELELTQDLV